MVKWQVFLLFLALLLVLPSVLSVSFSTLPVVLPNNASSVDSLACQFTPLGNGTLHANITWFYNDGSWHQYTFSDDSMIVSSGVLTTSSSVASSATTKDENWLCQVSLYNESATNYTNSSAVTIRNSPPIVTFPTTNQTVYEDSLFSLMATATDPDSDSILAWISPDLNSSLYNDENLFTIANSGLISFTLPDETKVGNHTVSLLAYDGTVWSGLNINFEVIAVDDLPEFDGPLSFTCEEQSWCNFSLSASDQENDSLVFAANESFINMNTSGFASFIPVFGDVGLHTIAANVTDGINYTFTNFNLTITSINHIPYFTYNSSLTSSGIQNQSSNFLFYVNASDIDILDAINFSIASATCDKNPWVITTLFNGTGAQNATALVNVSFSSAPSFIPNDFVECRNVTITATDGKENSYANFTFNITNTNDPPTIYNNSYYSKNGYHYNIHNVSSAKGLVFSYRVNATDIDNATYEGDSWNYSLFGEDPTKFKINRSNGLISSLASMDDAYIGNHSFLVVVTDAAGLSVNKTINITIINNSAPVIRTLDNSSCLEDIACIKYLIADDAEANIFNYTLFSLVYTPPAIINGSFTYDTNNKITYTDEQVRSLFVHYITFNSTSLEYRFNITANDSQVGLYQLNVTFKDLFSMTTLGSMTFNITNVNDNPLLDDNDNVAVADPIVLFPMVKNRLFKKYIYAIDDDLYYDLNNLTFSYSLPVGSNITANFNLTKVSKRSALLSFYPNSTHLGNHTVNFTVSDGKGGSDTEQVNFTVYEPSIPPNITQIRPYHTGVNTTVNALVSTSTHPSPETVYVSEGSSLTFEISATDPDSALQNLTLSWLYEGSKEKSSNYISSKSFVKSFDYFSSGSRTVLVNVSDDLYSYDSYQWHVVVQDTDQQPLFIHSLANLTAADNSSIAGPQNFVDFFRLSSPANIVFIDPDDDFNNNLELDDNETNTLSFSVNDSGGCGAYATFAFSGGNLLLTPTTVGTCYTNFITTDPDGLTVASNTIQIDILSLDSGNDNTNSNTNTVIVQKRVVIPLQEDVNVPKEFQLIIPGITTIYENGTVIVPLKIKNSWEKTLTGIHLSANASIAGLEHQFSTKDISSLAVNSEVQVNLTLRHYRLDAPFEINISAVIDSLKFTDTTIIYVNALEKGKEDSQSVKSMIGFARDLLSDNPECQELNELLDKAEKNSQANAKDSLQVVNDVIKGCKYLINTANKPQNTNPESFLGKLGLYTNALVNVRALITVLLILIIGAVGIGIFTKFHLKKI